MRHYCWGTVKNPVLPLVSHLKLIFSFIFNDYGSLQVSILHDFKPLIRSHILFNYVDIFAHIYFIKDILFSRQYVSTISIYSYHRCLKIYLISDFVKPISMFSMYRSSMTSLSHLSSVVRLSIFTIV